ncbi:MAG: hypothetical protein A4E73_03950 [Syntrophaceae bacterium PtaU1.Bin231]|nr:MAG: hypothetical protein A4E73_03950 [Syntrophaceae bacterium PtaU1.Bin231]
MQEGTCGRAGGSAGHRDRKEPGQEDRRSRAAQEIQGEYGRHRHSFPQHRPVQTRNGNPDQGIIIEDLFHRFDSPRGHEDGEEDERRPGPEYLALRIDELGLSDVPALARKTPALFRMPHPEQGHQADHRDQRSGDAGEKGAEVMGDERLRQGKGQSAHQRRGPGLQGLLPSAHHDHHVQGGEQTDQRQLPPHHSAQFYLVHSGDLSADDHGDPDPAECHRSRIRQQADSGRIEGVESQAGQHGGRDGDGCSESGRPFDEGAETESDQKRLDPAIVGNGGQGVFDDLEFTGPAGQVVDEQRRYHDPADRPQSEQHPENPCKETQTDRHPVYQGGDEGGDQDGAQGGQMTFHLPVGKRPEQIEDRNGRDQGGDSDMGQGIDGHGPSHAAYFRA